MRPGTPALGHPAVLVPKNEDGRPVGGTGTASGCRRLREPLRPRVTSPVCRAEFRLGNRPQTGDAVPAETHVEKGPLDRQQILELVRELLADILEIEPSTITESSSFAEDLDADSLALIELVEGLEEELSERSVGFRIDDEDLEELRTVRDAVDYVDAKIRQS